MLYGHFYQSKYYGDIIETESERFVLYPSVIIILVT